jgi:hypothetical protein
LASLPYGTLQVCSPWLFGAIDSDVDLVSRANPAVASTLVHEAFHQAAGVPDHLEQDGCGYDADPGGAYGITARWMWLWSRANAGRVPAPDAELAAIGRQTECTHIKDREGFAPYDGALPGLCDPQAPYTPMPDPL